MRDLRYAIRSLVKSPSFLLVATVCLGLALALNTTTFAILDAMRHPSLPVKDPDRLFEVRMWGRGAGADAPMSERFSVLREGTFYEDVSSYDWGGLVTVRAGNDVDERWVTRVSRNLFPMLGVRAEIGRLVAPGSPDNVALVSHDEWERSLGGRSLSGLTIWVGNQEYQVIGVLPPEMKLSEGPPEQDIWIPLPSAIDQLNRGTIVVVKVKRGWTLNGVTEQLGVLANRLTLEYGSGPVPYAFTLKSMVPDPLELKQIHFAMAGAAVVVLLVACVNLAGLMLVRGVVKRRELALRMALGADRATLTRQLFIESAVVVSIGAALGLMFTLWAVGLLRHQMPPSVAALGMVRPHPSWRVFVAGLGFAGATLLVFGLWPAVRASDVDVSEPLKENTGASIGHTHWRYSPLVISEVALGLMLLMGAVLLTRAVGRRNEALLGYDRTGLLSAWVRLGRQYGGDSVGQISHHLLASVTGVPEVRSVAALLSLWSEGPAMSEFYDGSNGLVNRASLLFIGDGFLRTLGIPVLQGRDFLPGDERDSAVIVDQTAASALWPDGRAVGRLVKLGGPKARRRWLRVVGVARAVSVGGPPSDPFLQPQGTIYVAWQPGGRAWGWQLVIRTTRLDAGSAIALRQAIQDAVAPKGRALWVAPWLSDFDVEVRARYFLVKVFGGFSAFALALATIGLYGVVSYSVSQRLREFAVRIAVGAPAQDVLKLVAHDAAVMILAGTGMGAFLAMWGATLLGDWLYNVYHTDALSLVVAEAVLLAAGFAACLQPALRAMRADPIEILRAI